MALSKEISANFKENVDIKIRIDKTSEENIYYRISNGNGTKYCDFRKYINPDRVLKDIVEFLNSIDHEKTYDVSEINKNGDLLRKIEETVQELREQGEHENNTGDDENSDDKKKLVTTRLVELALNNFKLFQDSFGEYYAAIPLNNVTAALQVVELLTDDFRDILAEKYYEIYGNVPSEQVLRAACGILKIHARKGGKRALYLRVCRNSDGSLLYDLCNEKWELVRIDKNGLAIIDHRKPVFIRFPHMLPQVKPKTHAKPEEFLKLKKYIKLERERDVKLLLAHICALIIPDVPRAVMVFAGDAGAGKSTLLSFLKDLIDPSGTPGSAFTDNLLTLPEDERELSRQFSQNFFLPYDNHNKISASSSDMLCKGVTGGSYSVRKLYTTKDGVWHSFGRAIGITGINVASWAGDFISRAIIYRFSDIPEEKRVSEEEIHERFENERQEIFSGMLAVVSRALRFYEQVKDETRGKLPRLGSFAIWLECMGRAMGFNSMEIFNLYKNKVSEQKLDVIKTDVIAELLINLINRSDGVWEGTPTELHREVRAIARGEGLSLHSLPRAPHTLVRHLNRIKANLSAIGLVIEQYRMPDHHRSKILRIEQRRKKRPKRPNRPKPGPRASDAIVDAIKSKRPIKRPRVYQDQSDASDASDASLASLSMSITPKLLQWLHSTNAMPRGQVIGWLTNQGLAAEEAHELLNLLIERGRVMHDKKEDIIFVVKW